MYGPGAIEIGRERSARSRNPVEMLEEVLSKKTDARNHRKSDNLNGERVPSIDGSELSSHESEYIRIRDRNIRRKVAVDRHVEFLGIEFIEADLKLPCSGKR